MPPEARCRRFRVDRFSQAGEWQAQCQRIHRCRSAAEQAQVSRSQLDTLDLRLYAHFALQILFTRISQRLEYRDETAGFGAAESSCPDSRTRGVSSRAANPDAPDWTVGSDLVAMTCGVPSLSGGDAHANCKRPTRTTENSLGRATPEKPR